MLPGQIFSRQGRMPDNDETYLIIRPHTRPRVIETTAALEHYYGNECRNMHSGQVVDLKWKYGEYPKR